MSEHENTDGLRTPILQRVVEPVHPAYLEAKANAEQTVQAAAVPGLTVLDGLMDHIRTMRVSDRYRTDRIPTRDGINYGDGVPNPRLVGLNEPDHERESLLIETEKLQSELVSWGSRLHDLVMRVQASQTD